MLVSEGRLKQVPEWSLRVPACHTQVSQILSCAIFSIEIKVKLTMPMDNWVTIPQSPPLAPYQWTIKKKKEGKPSCQGNNFITELPVDYGHVRNSLIAVIITHTIEFFGGHIDGRNLKWRLTTYLWVNLRFAKRFKVSQQINLIRQANTANKGAFGEYLRTMFWPRSSSLQAAWL